MDLLLNEKSLTGQFPDALAFYNTLPSFIECLKILEQFKISLHKSVSFYQSMITKELSVRELANRREQVPPTERDKVREFKKKLYQLQAQEPFWDAQTETVSQNLESCYFANGEDVSATSVAEAAVRGGALLSFQKEGYGDCVVTVEENQEQYQVPSAQSGPYLAKVLYDGSMIETEDFLNYYYRGTKLRFDQMDKKLGTAVLELKELETAQEAFSRFCSESWDEIVKDRYFYYKQYQPSNQDNWFKNTEYQEKTIHKFRCGMHSQIRCFGYREGDFFYVLRMERDHSISDNG